MAEKTYKTKESCRMTGCTHRQLQYWEEKKYLHPILGSRNIRHYTETDLRLIKDLVKQKQQGFTLGEARYQQIMHNTPNQEAASLQIIKKLEENKEFIDQWIMTNEVILKLMNDVLYLEQHLPKFPYTIYVQADVDRLKLLQQKIIYYKKKRDYLAEKVTTGMASTIQPSAEIAMPLIKSVDELVLWVAKKDQISSRETIKELRQKFEYRLRTGESIREIELSLA